MQRVQVSESGMEKFLESLLSVSNQSFTLSRGTSGSNGAWRRWSTGAVEIWEQNTETIRL